MEFPHDWVVDNMFSLTETYDRCVPYCGVGYYGKINIY